ncbi:hypothetical protein [Zhihengliuella halotolerans]|uniref:hypothetical protein n=1 Tax=Zhihengliuella halotolerans TaxID=370736 RepID=UPI000C80E916|nr:hypothetical protein [Zhihengliuella halotolerans]
MAHEKDDEQAPQTGSPFGDKEYDGGQKQDVADNEDVQRGTTGSPFGDNKYDGGQKQAELDDDEKS